MFNYTRRNFKSLPCDDAANISTWKTCHENALDREMNSVNHRIKTTSLILMMIGVVSSSLVCMVVIRMRRVPQRTVSNALIMNLAISDIIFRLVYVMTRFMVPIFHVQLSAMECKIILYSHYACAAVTFTLLAGMAIDRYRQIVHPLKYFYMNRSRRILLILSLWVYAYVASIGFILVGKGHHFHKLGRVPKKFRKFNTSTPERITYRSKSSKYCSLDKNSFKSQLAYTPYFTFAFLAPLLIIIFTYSSVFRFLKARSKHNLSKVAAKSKRKALKMMVVVVACYVICWLPVMLVDLLSVYGVKFGQFTVRNFLSTFSYSSSIISPVIYAFWNANFRNELRNMLQSLKAPFVHGNCRCKHVT